MKGASSQKLVMQPKVHNLFFQMTALKGFDRFQCKTVESELAAFDALVKIVRMYVLRLVALSYSPARLAVLFFRYDPDILVGYEVQLLSWGFLFERAQFLGIELCALVSRIPGKCKPYCCIDAANLCSLSDSPRQSRFSTRDDWWAMADIHVAGRIVLNLGRIMRHEVSMDAFSRHLAMIIVVPLQVTLYIYSFENLVYNALRQRVPAYEFRTLTRWFSSLKTR